MNGSNPVGLALVPPVPDDVDVVLPLPEADKLSQNDLLDFKDRIYDMELKRYYNTVDRGKQEALDKGYEAGTKALKAGRSDITPEQYRGSYPKDTTAKYGKYFFDIGFIAGATGEEKPEVPR